MQMCNKWYSLCMLIYLGQWIMQVSCLLSERAARSADARALSISCDAETVCVRFINSRGCMYVHFCINPPPVQWVIAFLIRHSFTESILQKLSLHYNLSPPMWNFCSTVDFCTMPFCDLSRAAVSRLIRYKLKILNGMHFINQSISNYAYHGFYLLSLPYCWWWLFCG